MSDSESSDEARVKDFLRCRQRIGTIAALPQGWLDGDGRAVTRSAVAAAETLLAARPALAGAYHIFPTPSGGILFEFDHAGWDYSVDVRPDGSIEVFGVEVQGSGDLDPNEFRGVDDEALRFVDGLLESPRNAETVE